MNLHRVEPADLPAVLTLAADVIGPERAGPFVRSHTERHHVTVAEEAGAVVGFIAYRTDWFQCTFVSLVSVHKDFRRRGVARALFKMVEDMSPGPRVFSSTEETNAKAIQMLYPPALCKSSHRAAPSHARVELNDVAAIARAKIYPTKPRNWLKSVLSAA